MEIRVDNLTGSEIIALLQEHLRCMAEVSPPESCHALDLEGLRDPSVTFWTLWSGSDLAGCGAIKALDKEHAEIKSMRTAYAFQRTGVASRMLRHIIEEARRRGCRRLSLETGSMDYFQPARRLYSRFGFIPCGPFGSYKEDPNSVFMTIELPPAMVSPNLMIAIPLLHVSSSEGAEAFYCGCLGFTKNWEYRPAVPALDPAYLGLSRDGITPTFLFLRRWRLWWRCLLPCSGRRCTVHGIQRPQRTHSSGALRPNLGQPRDVHHGH